MTTVENHGATAGHNIQIQIGGDAEPPESPEPPPSFTPWVVGFFTIAGIFFLVVKLVSFLGGSDSKEDAFPTHSDPWPARATTPAVLAPVVSKLQSCAAEQVPEPVNCPQRVSDATSERATWNLVGDPAVGTRIKYRQGRFDLIGHALMTARYDGFTGQKFSLQRLIYRAEVNWNNGHPVLAGQLRTTSTNPDAPVIKSATGQTWSHVQVSLQQAFRRCELSRVAPMPLDCPHDPQTDIASGDAHWHFDSNPLQNTSSVFDPSWGLINVTGNYAVTMRTGGWTPLTEHGGGAYKAVLAVDRTGWPQVLRIERRSSR